MTESDPEGTEGPNDAVAVRSSAAEASGWRRLDRRMIVVDAVQAFVSVVPVVVATWVSGGSLGGGLWPLFAVAVSGVLGAAVDAYRWATTRYRVTDEMVERRSGILVRSHRSVRRDRIRSVDIHAKLRHRLGGLRIVKIGAGQQTVAGEAAFDLDAVSITDARALQALLLQRSGPNDSSLPTPPLPDDVAQADGVFVERPPTPAAIADADDHADHAEVLARFRPGWVVYNVFNVWAYAMALGLLWGATWFLPTVGLDAGDFVGGIIDWEALGPVWTFVIALAAVSVIGVVGLGINFFVEQGNFELARVRTTAGGTVLRTRHGLLTTREVARDENRMRGVQLSEPLWWRWMGVADTTVITTGLNMAAMSQPAAILPRGPVAEARPVAAAVLGVYPSPLDAELRSHPRAALRRRLGWATLASTAVSAVLAWLAVTSVVPASAFAAVIVLWPIALIAAVVAHRALGHTISGEYLVVRSGLLSRSTTAIQRSAVSTIAVRESLFQRRLGLQTVSVMTSAGTGAYDAFDLDRDEAVSFAADAAPDVLTRFLTTEPPQQPGSD